jgi:hypothetical protein
MATEIGITMESVATKVTVDRMTTDVTVESVVAMEIDE